MFFKAARFILLAALPVLGFIIAYRQYSNADFGDSFDRYAGEAQIKLAHMQEKFVPCAMVAKTEIRFLQALVFPELMRYNTLKDDIETESLRTLYVQFGPVYADFSIGIFQMKPSFAEQVENLAKQLLPGNIYQDLQLQYEPARDVDIRLQRIQRLMNEDWQLVYLTAFVCICNKLYKYKTFSGDEEKLQWFATIYNSGFTINTEYLERKVNEANFYLEQQMPGKKFRYAAIASWYYNLQNSLSKEKQLYPREINDQIKQTAAYPRNCISQKIGMLFQSDERISHFRY